ncbi:MAG: metal-dependent hydrolase [Gemmatimonadaceae bacterium]
MITGHLGLALGARAVDPEAPVSWLVVAAMAPDIADFGLAAFGICNPDGEYTHSLVAVVATALVLGAAAFWWSRRRRMALVIGALVVSHLLADYLTGTKALWIGGPVFGLNLYRWPLADLVLEAAVVTAGWWAGRRWGRVSRWAGSRIVLAVLLSFQFVIDAASRPNQSDQSDVCAKAGVIKQFNHLF